MKKRFVLTTNQSFENFLQYHSIFSEGQENNTSIEIYPQQGYL